MRKSLLISEQDNIAALLENDRVCEFFVNRGELLLGDIYTCTVENILPGIDAAFVNLGKDKMGFLHANDVPGQGPLKERLVPKQKLLVQITKEPTGHKGPRVSTAISLPGRFLVLVPEERGVSISRRISESRERARLKSVVNLMKPPGVGLIIRTEAKGQGENELFEDFQQLWDTWQTIVSEAEASIGPLLIYRDQDLLYRVIRDAYSHEVNEIIVDSPDGQKRAADYLQGWASKNTKVSFHVGDESLLISKGMDREIETALTDRAELPSGGHLNIEPTEALTVIDVNSGRFTSSRTQAETVRRTNLEAAQEIPRQLRLRNIGGMVIVDFIDMESRKDQQQVLEVFQRALEDDRAKPQIGQLSDLGLVELTRRRQGQSLRELFTAECSHCTGQGVTATLELGNMEQRRPISLKAVDDDSSSRRSSSRGKSGAVLKSASASNGRIISTVGPNEEEEVEVPEEILAQVPEDLLQDREDRLRQRRRSEETEFGDEEESEFSATEDDVTLEVNAGSISPRSQMYVDSLTEEDEAPQMDEELKKNISAVEEVYQEIGSSRSPVIEVETASIVEADDDDDDDDDDEEDSPPSTHIEDEEEEENFVDETVEFTPVSSHEAIEGSVSGVFTLKPRPEQEQHNEQPQRQFESSYAGSDHVARSQEETFDRVETIENRPAHQSYGIFEEKEAEGEAGSTGFTTESGYTFGSRHGADSDTVEEEAVTISGYQEGATVGGGIVEERSYDQLKIAAVSGEGQSGDSEGSSDEQES
jgi:ribonuclease, Rne/Rng family